MKKYEYLPHTADVKFRAYGKNLEETFSNAATAMMNVMVDTKNVKAATAKKIKAEGDDLQALLYNFLEQFLILMDSENLFLTTIKTLKITTNKKNGSYKLTATIAGDDAGKYETTGPQVKAITYNDMTVTDKMAQAVVDI
ncbi:archease [Candidatus Woesearchaeota archaeon]|nr:archease [Candidatus Woesearchaeota archaeon]